MKQLVNVGTVDYTVLIKIMDESSTAGAALTGLIFSDIDISYTRVETDNDVTNTACAPADLATPALTDPHLDWGFLEVSSSEAPGLYRLDIADGVFAAGATSAVVTIRDAADNDIVQVDLEFQLVAFDVTDGVRLGLTALPNAAADAAGGLPISDAGGLDLDAILADTNELQLEIANAHVWHVAKTGNDGNGGHSFDAAKLTIGATITAAAAGDTIYVWPGTYAEKVTLSKALNLIGHGKNITRIEPAADSALVLGAAGCTVKNIGAKSVQVGGYYGIKNGDYNNQVIEGCYGEGSADGCHCGGGDNIWLKDSYFKSTYDGLQLLNGNNIIVDGCICETDGSYDTANVNCIVSTGGVNHVIRNTTCYGRRALNDGGTVYGLTGISPLSQMVLENVIIDLDHTGTGATHKVIGIGGAGAIGDVLGRGLQLHIDSTYGEVHSIYGGSGIITLESGLINTEPYRYQLAVTAQGGDKKKEFVCSTSTVPDVMPNDYFNGWILYWKTGNNAGESEAVLDWVTATNTFSFTAGFTYDIEVDDEFLLMAIPAWDITNSSVGTVRIVNCHYDPDFTTGTVLRSGADIDVDSEGKVDLTDAPNATAVTAIQSEIRDDISAVGSTCTNILGDVDLVDDTWALAAAINDIVAHADYGNAQLVRSTDPANTLDVSSTGEVGLDFANIKDATGAHTLTNITVPTVTTVGTCTTNTDMRGTDSAATATALATVDGIVDAILVDTGTTLDGKINDIKAKTDNLPTTPASASTLLGSGAITFTYTVTNSGTGLPIADADVWATTDAAGANIVASGRTDQNGQVTFYLDAGTIYIFTQKSGVNFVNPDQETVA